MFQFVLKLIENISSLNSPEYLGPGKILNLLEYANVLCSSFTSIFNKSF